MSKKKNFKEIKFRPGISEHDFSTKLKQVDKLLAKGINVKCVVMLNGRSIIHPGLGESILDKVINSIQNGKLVNRTPLKNRDITIFLAPKG